MDGGREGGERERARVRAKILKNTNNIVWKERERERITKNTNRMVYERGEAHIYRVRLFRNFKP